MVPRGKAVNHNPLVMLKPWTVATLTVACLLCVGNVFAQCNIDFDFGEEPFGVSPDPTVGESFNSGVLDEDYFDVLHILLVQELPWARTLTLRVVIRRCL